MHAQDKRDANDDQLQTYFNSYDQFWRLHKLILTKDSLASRESHKNTLESFYGKDFFDYDQLLYENITNGLLADGISEVVMLCEDYFGLLKFIRDPHYFVKKILSYNAGKVQSIGKKLENVTDEKFRSMFFIPPDSLIKNQLVISNAETAEIELLSFNKKIELLKTYHADAVIFYKKYEKTYNLYKHGLKLCLSGVGDGASHERLKKQRTTMSANVWTFENDNRKLSGLVIPNINSHAIAKNAGALLKDRNLLHIGLMNHMHIDNLIQIASNINALLTILIANRISLITSKNRGLIEVHLPSGNTKRMTSTLYQFPSIELNDVPTLKDYQLKI